MRSLRTNHRSAFSSLMEGEYVAECVYERIIGSSLREGESVAKCVVYGRIIIDSSSFSDGRRQCGIMCCLRTIHRSVFPSFMDGMCQNVVLIVLS